MSKSLIIFLILLIVFIGCIGAPPQTPTPTPEPTQPAATPAPTTTAPPTTTPIPTTTVPPITTAPTQPKKADIKLLSKKVYLTEMGYQAVVGEVQNVGDANAGNVEISVMFYNERNQIVTTSLSTTELRILKPGQKSPFKAFYYGKLDFATVELQWKWKTTEIEPYDNFTILSHKGKKTPDGYYVIEGTVKNIENKERGYVKIVATFYDTEGNVVGTSYRYASFSQPESNTPSLYALFKLTEVEKMIVRLIANYTLQAQA